MANIVTTEIKHLSPGKEFTFRNRKTVFTFLEDNGLTYKYQNKNGQVFEDDYYNRIVDAKY